MAIVKGTIKVKSSKFAPKESILLEENDGVWYSSKFGIKADRGDYVEFDDGGGKMCKNLRVLNGSGGSAPPANNTTYKAPSGGFPVPYNTKDRSIVRQNSLTHATTLVTKLMEVQGLKPAEDDDTFKEYLDTWADAVEYVARKFESYSAGDEEGAAAKELIDD